jgi:hypothetical protein
MTRQEQDKSMSINQLGMRMVPFRHSMNELICWQPNLDSEKMHCE